MFIKKITKFVLSGMLLGAIAVAPACKKGGGGGGDLTPPAAPEYESAFDEMKDIPTQIDVQVKWITQPIDDAHKLGDEFNALKESLQISAEDLGAMATASFKDGTIEVSADLSIADEKKAEVEAFLGKVKASGEAVMGIPKRAQKVTGWLTKMPMKVPGLAKKALDEQKAKLEAAVGDVKVEIQANIELIPNLQTEIVEKSKATIGDVKNIPADSKAQVEELVLAFSGKGEFKAAAGGDEEEAGGDEDDLGGEDEAGEEAGGEEAGGEEAAAEGGEEAAAE